MHPRLFVTRLAKCSANTSAFPHFTLHSAVTFHILHSVFYLCIPYYAFPHFTKGPTCPQIMGHAEHANNSWPVTVTHTMSTTVIKPWCALETEHTSPFVRDYPYESVPEG